MSDRETLAVYGARAEDYAALVSDERPQRALLNFLDRVPPGGKVLDWGCGAGNSAAAMRDRGFDVAATDASPEFAALAKRTYDLDVTVATFFDLEANGVYDGVWASFSLLHAPKVEMPRHLAAAYRALKPGGQLYIGMKIGEGEQRDSIGRFYAYYSEAELKGLLADAGFTVTGQRGGVEVGLDGKDWPFIMLDAHA